MQEMWKSIPDCKNNIEVSQLGNVRRLNVKSNTYTPVTVYDTNGYDTIYFAGKYHFLHRVVAELFVENPNNYSCVVHKDGNKRNNSADNLEWVDESIRAFYSLLGKHKKLAIIKEATTELLFVDIASASMYFGIQQNAIKHAIKSRADCFGLQFGYVTESAEAHKLLFMISSKYIELSQNLKNIEELRKNFIEISANFSNLL